MARLRAKTVSPDWLDDHSVAPAFKRSKETLITEITQTLLKDECYHFKIDILVSSVIGHQDFGNQNNRQFRQKSPRRSRFPRDGVINAFRNALN